MTNFEINGVTYVAKPFDFNLACDLEDMGLSLGDAQTKPMGLMRAYFGFCSGLNKELAGSELENHIINGGDFSGIMEAMTKELGESDFFRSLNKSKAKEVTKTTRKKKAENTEV